MKSLVIWLLSSFFATASLHATVSLNLETPINCANFVTECNERLNNNFLEIGSDTNVFGVYPQAEMIVSTVTQCHLCVEGKEAPKNFGLCMKGPTEIAKSLVHFWSDGNLEMDDRGKATVASPAEAISLPKNIVGIILNSREPKQGSIEVSTFFSNYTFSASMGEKNVSRRLLRFTDQGFRKWVIYNVEDGKSVVGPVGLIAIAKKNNSDRGQKPRAYFSDYVNSSSNGLQLRSKLRPKPIVEDRCFGCHAQGLKRIRDIPGLSTGASIFDVNNEIFSYRESHHGFAFSKVYSPAIKGVCLTCHQSEKSGASYSALGGFIGPFFQATQIKYLQLKGEMPAIDLMPNENTNQAMKNKLQDLLSTDVRSALHEDAAEIKELDEKRPSHTVVAEYLAKTQSDKFGDIAKRLGAFDRSFVTRFGEAIDTQAFKQGAKQSVANTLKSSWKKDCIKP